MQSMRGCRAAGLAAIVTGLALQATSAAAVTLGAVDTFQGGSMLDWGSGAPNPNPPTLVASGGPGGAGDAFLSLASSGGAGPGSRLVVFNQAQWTGDYNAAHITAITMDLANFGSTPLELHLQFNGTAGIALSSGFLLAPGSGWQHATFSLAPSALSGVAAALNDVTELRLFHGSTAPVAVVAQLGMDNIAAVPEPATVATLLAGLAALAILMRRGALRASPLRPGPQQPDRQHRRRHGPR